MWFHLLPVSTGLPTIGSLTGSGNTCSYDACQPACLPPAPPPPGSQNAALYARGALVRGTNTACALDRTKPAAYEFGWIKMNNNIWLPVLPRLLCCRQDRLPLVLPAGSACLTPAPLVNNAATDNAPADHHCWCLSSAQQPVRYCCCIMYRTPTSISAAACRRGCNACLPACLPVFCLL